MNAIVFWNGGGGCIFVWREREREIEIERENYFFIMHAWNYTDNLP